MTDTFAAEELAFIAECAGLPDRAEAFRRLTERFGARGTFTLTRVMEAADRLTEVNQPVDIGNGETLMRTNDLSGYVIGPAG